MGTLNLRSGVEFRFETGACLIATTDLTQYQRHNDELAGVFYTEDASNAISAKDVDGLRLLNVSGSASPSNPKLPAVSLTNCKGVVNNMNK